MSPSNRDDVRGLLRRVDEVRGLADGAGGPVLLGLDDPDTLVRTLGELVEELERSHRRLIETNVQLVSLREVASRLATTVDAGETTRTVTRYLQRAFGFEEVCLLLVDAGRGVLTGAWTSGGPAAGTAGDTAALELPVVGERGALARALWLDRTLLHHDCRRHPPALLAETHPLHEVFERLGSLAVVPLPRSRGGDVDADCREGCGAADPDALVPPPGADPQAWREARDEAQRRCLAADHLPSLGVIAAARAAGAPPLAGGEVTLLESIALSVAPMIENARLFQELRRSQRFQQHVLDSMASALVAVSLEGAVLSLNRAAEDLLRWPAAEAAGLPVGDVFGSEGEAIVAGTIGRGLEVVRQETLLRTRDGAALPVRMTTSLLRDEAGRVYGAIATFLDLTPIKAAEEHARQMDRLAALGRFTSSVAHEIRNPLTGIGMGVQHLARALRADAGQRENLEFILSEIRRLDRIVQQLFDVTHPRRLDLEPRPLEETLRRALLSLEHLIAERGLRVTLEVEPGVPPVAHDADQMQQVFINLIKNAAEASAPNARITLQVAAAPPGGPAAAPAVVASVRDEGRGIDADTRRTLFEPFVTTKPGGTGLGLYITHDIVKRHGGSLTVASEPGCGATFRVELPLQSHGGAR